MMANTTTHFKGSGPTLRGMLTIYPVQERIFRELDTKSILNLCRTSWDMRLDIKAYCWDINKKLGRFFNNPQAFRTELGRADAVISGSFALQFFARKLWPESDLDIVVRNTDAKVYGLQKYLIEKEGYELTSDQKLESRQYHVENGIVTISPYRSSEIDRIITLHRNDKEDGDKDDKDDAETSTASSTPRTKVQLIATREQPVKAILNDYYTTCIMNFITWNKAYCLFPRATLLFNETVPLIRIGDEHIHLFAKYALRGWRTRVHLERASAKDIPVIGDLHHRGRARPLGNPIGADRFIGSRETWTMRLDTSGVARPEQPDSVLEWSSFQIDGLADQANSVMGEGLGISAKPFRSNALRWEYSYGNMRPHWRDVGRALERNTLAQMNAKMLGSEAGKHVEAFNSHTSHNLNLDKPAGWDYWDDVLPVYFEARLRMKEEGYNDNAGWALPG